MEPKIIQEEMILLAGMSFYGDPFETSSAWSEENQIGCLWRRLMTYINSHKDTLAWHSYQVPYYEVHIDGPETETEGLFEVFVGLQISDLDDLPFDLVVKVLPSSQFAVFTLEGKAITEDWDSKISRWLSENGYREAYPYNFQYYDHRFKGMDRIDESCIDVYIPIKTK